ncbi:MAG: Extracellular ribonuclease [Verrucomicrobiota bacterium]
MGKFPSNYAVPSQPRGIPHFPPLRSPWWLAGVVALVGTAAAQTQPSAQALPYAQDFGGVPFTTLPAGLAAWGGLSGVGVNTPADAAASAATADASVAAATAAQTTGGSYGLATGDDARFYIQSSSSTTHGANQLALAIDTTGQAAVTLSYDLEIISAQPRMIGVLCQCRVGTSGGWTTLTATSGANPFSQAGGITGPKGKVQTTLPAATANQALVQLRWATWRGSESGNSSGVAIDNPAAVGTAISNSLAIQLSAATISEPGGTTTATVTTASPVSADLPVTLTISDPTEAVVATAATVLIPAGFSTAVFEVRAVDDLVWDGPQAVTLTASAPGTTPVSAMLTVTDNEDAWSPPETHYAAAAGLSGAALKAALKTIAATNHRPYDYKDTFAPLRAIHPDPANSANILTVYSGASIAKSPVYQPNAGLDPDLTWSREHLWPVSYGLDPDGINPGATQGDAGPDYTDLFNLRPAIHTVNGQRGNRIFDETSGSPSVPQLAPLCSYDTDSWEPRDSEKGDIARAMFYMATRYDGSDPLTLDLELSNTPATAVGRFGRLSTLLRWHEQDPVSPLERQQNQLIFATYQKNRNPFLDHPEYAALIWGTVRVTPTALAIAEGGPAASYTLALTSQPTADVIFHPQASPGSQLMLAPASVTFTPANWNVPQTITVTATDDALFETTATAAITHSIDTADANYATAAADSVTVTVTDNDPLIAPLPLPLSYGGPWSPLPAQGFLGVGVGTYSTSLGNDADPGSAKFDDTGDRLTVAFSGPPGTLSYQLKGNPASGSATAGTFQVLQSADGAQFTLVRTHLNLSGTAQAFADPLLPATRFVAFFYETKTGGNLQFDALAIASASPWIAWLAVANLTGPAAAPGADPDADGLTNLAEYALGTPPQLPDAAGPTLERLPGKLRLTATLRTSDPALTTAAETTTTLATWTSAGISSFAAPDQSGVPPGFVRTHFDIADALAPARFVRLRFGLALAPHA